VRTDRTRLLKLPGENAQPVTVREVEYQGTTVSVALTANDGMANRFFGSAVALKRDAQRTPRKDDPEARHKAEIERMRAVIAEITAENLELKKKI